MTAIEIYRIARVAGFPAVVAVTMTAIALRESAGDPKAFNGNTATGDESYGLWQINMLGGLGVQRRPLFGITDNAELFDPVVSARAAAKIWAGNNGNLSIAWYINHEGPYKTRYESHLPAAQAAALIVG